jgi:hypothetical protein
MPSRGLTNIELMSTSEAHDGAVDPQSLRRLEALRRTAKPINPQAIFVYPY